MRPNVYAIVAGSVLVSVLISGCSGNATPSGETGPSVATSSAAASVAPSPTVALREPHSLVYSATGTAAVISATYELDGHKITQRSVSLPWRKVVEVPADGKRHTWSLVLEHRSGRVELVAIFDNAVTGRASNGVSGGGTGTASAGGSLRG